MRCAGSFNSREPFGPPSRDLVVWADRDTQVAVTLGAGVNEDTDASVTGIEALAWISSNASSSDADERVTRVSPAVVVSIVSIFPNTGVGLPAAMI
jgi:hypothetical protein